MILGEPSTVASGIVAGSPCIKACKMLECEASSLVRGNAPNTTVIQIKLIIQDIVVPNIIDL